MGFSYILSFDWFFSSTSFLHNLLAPLPDSTITLQVLCPFLSDTRFTVFPHTLEPLYGPLLGVFLVYQSHAHSLPHKYILKITNWDLHMRENMQHVSFLPWKTLFNVIIFSSIHFPENLSFLYEWKKIPSSVNGYQVQLHFLAVVITVIHIGMQVSQWWDRDSFVYTPKGWHNGIMWEF